jgi:hypothetical protein
VVGWRFFVFFFVFFCLFCASPPRLGGRGSGHAHPAHERLGERAPAGEELGGQQAAARVEREDAREGVGRGGVAGREARGLGRLPLDGERDGGRGAHKALRALDEDLGAGAGADAGDDPDVVAEAAGEWRGGRGAGAEDGGERGRRGAPGRDLGGERVGVLGGALTAALLADAGDALRPANVAAREGDG